MLFSKMNGLGNDYIFIDSYNASTKDIEFIKQNSDSVIPKLSDRHFGIGGDGVVLIEQSCLADAKMTIYNADGSLAKMCGNALRCVGKILYDRDGTKNEFIIETLSGEKQLEIINSFNIEATIRTEIGRPYLDEVIDDVYFINIGNPHAVFYASILDENAISRARSISLKYDVNAEVVAYKEGVLNMRVWERGANETLACGTGASAVAYCSYLKGICDSKVKVKLLGGELTAEYYNNCIYITGNASRNYIGELDIQYYG